MAKRKPVTLGDLLLPVIEAREFTAWCEKAGVRPQTVANLLDGKVGRPHRGTVIALAKALGIGDDAVKAAIEAQRAAKG